MARMETVAVGGSPMDIYYDGPADTVPRPTVLLMYHRGGIDGFTKSVVATLAEAGYRVAVPDVSHRVARDVPMAERKKFFKDSEVLADMRAAVAFLKSRREVDGGNLVLMGHCMGGRMTILGAGALRDFRAAVVFYGGGVMLSWGDEGATPFDGIRSIACPVIGFFGDKDVNPSPENVDRIAAEMTRHGIRHVFHRYPDVGHGFQNPAHDSPEERAAAADSWAKTLDFLRRTVPQHA